MIINKSIVEWHDLETLPIHNSRVLVFWFDSAYDIIRVSCGCYDECRDNFSHPDMEPTCVYENVMAWAEYPTLYIVLDRQGKNQAYVSEAW